MIQANSMKLVSVVDDERGGVSAFMRNSSGMTLTLYIPARAWESLQSESGKIDLLDDLLATYHKGKAL